MTVDYIESVETQGQLDLSYNHPLPVPPNFTAVCGQTTQATSILQVENLSTSNVLSFYVNAGSYTHQGVIPANDATPWSVAMNFNGAKLEVSNISTRDAKALVTLRST